MQINKIVLKFYYMTICIFIINLNVMMMIKNVITCMPKSLEISVRRQLNN